MTALVATRRHPELDGGRATARALVHASLLVGLLGFVMATRASAVRGGVDPLLVGLAFGLGIAALSALGERRLGAMPKANDRSRDTLPRAVATGVGFGVALVALTTLAPTLVGEPFVSGLGRPATALLPWAGVTIVVAVAQEALLRGVLLDRIERVAGPIAAIAATAAVFALMHVPLYGWHVVPLDLAVGIGLGGLRLATGRVAAPAAAHAVADLATWWL